MENILENEVKLENNLVNEKDQNNFLETTLGKTINTGIDIGIRALLPDFIDDQVINIKNNLLKNGLKEGISKTIDDTIEIDIRPEDLEIGTYRSSGAGGQHINKTDSAVRITHKPTGVTVSCQTERSQLQNKETAMKMLRSKLFEIKQRENVEKISDIKGNQMEIAWGSQIRSYVFCPYTLVKDHRTSYEETVVEKVMDGNIDGFINAYLVNEFNKNK